MSGSFRLILRHWRPCHSLSSSLTPSATWTSRQPTYSGAVTGDNVVPLSQHRTYASKAKGKEKGRDRDVSDKSATDKDKTSRSHRVDTGMLIPGSQQVLSGNDQAEYEKTDAKMQAAVDWFRRETATMEMQGSGRVSPDVLKPVRVALPGAGEGETCSLTEVATVGVREGTTLLVTVFAEDTLKHVEKAIYAAHIPHVVPQRHDARTIKIPMPKPTVVARAELAKAAAKLAENSRVQLRHLEQTSVKKGKYVKHSIEMEEFHELLQKHLKEIEKILSDVKKNLGVK